MSTPDEQTTAAEAIRAGLIFCTDERLTITREFLRNVALGGTLEECHASLVGEVVRALSAIEERVNALGGN